jgi:16S rRNA (guanine527-N7)-methyltransferase
LPDELFTAADQIFGSGLEVAEAYAEFLANDGVLRGLIGPREAPRIWDRHILNCAVVQELIPADAAVVDVGSGAGLPGIPLAIARPDIHVTLVEPLLRRTVFLDEIVDRLELAERITVVRGRAEELISMFHVKPADVATARAVAPLERLAGWMLPLVGVGGRLLAMKGASAAEEIAESSPAVHALGGGHPEIRSCGSNLLSEPTTVVEIVRERESSIRQAKGAKAGRKSARR